MLKYLPAGVPVMNSFVINADRVIIHVQRLFSNVRKMSAY